MRDTPRQTAHRLQLLALAQLIVRRLEFGGPLDDSRFQGLVEFAQQFLGALARGYVDRRAGDPDATVGLVEHTPALRRHPPDQAVFLADGAVLDVVEGAPIGVGRGGVGRAGRRPIVRMQAVVEILHGHGRVRGNAEHRFGARRPDEHVIDRIHVPEPDFRVLGGQAQAFCGFPKFRLGLAALGDVDRDPGHAAWDAVGVVGRLSAHVHPAGLARRREDPIFDIVVAARGQAFFHGAHHPRLVFRMHRCEQLGVGERLVGIAPEVLATDLRTGQGVVGQVQAPGPEPARLQGYPEIRFALA